MIEIPHFDLPFRYRGTAPVVAEQDSLADIINCVKAILLTEIGMRVEVPGFGIVQPVFGQQPLDLSTIIAQIAIYEPRANVLLDQYPDVLDALVADINVTVSKGEV